MKRYLVGAALCMVLVSCGTTGTSGSTPQTPAQGVFAAKSAYLTALQVAVAYAKMPRCGAPTSPPLCSQQSVVDQLKQADSVAGASLDAAEATVRTPGAGANVATLVTAAEQAVAALTTITSTLKVK